MGFRKERRPLLAVGGARLGSTHSSGKRWGPGQNVTPVQTISLSGASGIGSTAITNRGITFITSTGTGAGWTLTITDPGQKGVEKKIILVENGASTLPITVRTASSSGVFFGSTKNGISLTTAAGSTQPTAVSLLSFSSRRWGVIAIGSPVSTAIGWVTSTASTV